MSDLLNLNQFKLSQVVGSVDLTFFGGENVISVIFNPNSTPSTNTLVPGQGVKLVDLGAIDGPGLPVVDVRSGANDPIFGTVVRDTKNATYSPNDRVEIALAGCPMWFYSASALPRGSLVTLDEATPGNVLKITGTQKSARLGYTLDSLAGAGLTRVMIQADPTVAGTNT